MSHFRGRSDDLSRRFVLQKSTMAASASMGLNFSPINKKRVRTNVGITSNRTHVGHKVVSGRKQTARKLEAEPRSVADVVGDIRTKREKVRRRRPSALERQSEQDRAVAEVITTGKRRRQRPERSWNYFGSAHRHSSSSPDLNSLRMQAGEQEDEQVWRRPQASLQAPLRSVLMDSSVNTFPSHNSHARFKRSVKRTNYQHPSCE